MTEASRIRALTEVGLIHPHADAVVAPLFAGGGFFLAADKVQVKYEMLRAHLVDGITVTDVAVAHGYSRAGFYVVQAAFERAGMTGLIDDKRGRRGPVKLSPEIVQFLHAAPASASGGQLVDEVAAGSACSCTVARWNGHAGGDRDRVRLARAGILAGGRGRTGGL